MGKRIIYEDQWILDHYDPNVGWGSLLDAYNQEHRTDISYSSFVNHIFRKLHIQQNVFKYSKEHDAFLRKCYPVYGNQKTTEMFNEHFGTNRSFRAISRRCISNLHLKVNEKRLTEARKESGLKGYKYQPIGAISSKTYGTPAVKTEEGWKRLDRMTIGDVKDDEIIVHLDMNKENNDPENLMVIKKSITVRMAKNHFWSEHPEITKTGILWCQLDEALEKNGFVKACRRNYAKNWEVRIPKTRQVIPDNLTSGNKTGEKFIYKCDRPGRGRKLWLVQINNQLLHYSHAFETRERAIEVRDLLLNGLKQRI